MFKNLTLISKRLSSLKYQDAQIEKVLTHKISVLISYVINPLLFLFFLYDYIPLKFLLPWVFLHIFLYFTRILIVNKVFLHIKNKNQVALQKVLRVFLVIIALNAFLWGIAAYPILIYIGELYVYLLLSMIIIQASTSIATLVTMYHAIFIYITTSIITFFVVLLLYGMFFTHFIVMAVLLVYLLVTLPACFILYRTMEENTNKTMEISNLNNTLETKITEAIDDLEKAQHLAKIGSWSFEIDNDRFYCSKETYNIFDMCESEINLNFQDFLNIFDKDNSSLMSQSYYQHLEKRKDYNLVVKIRTNKNNVKWIESKWETTYDSAGKASVSIGTIQDITDKKTKEFELQKKEKLLYQQSKLAQMGEMISMIAHQWRQPLAAISATSTGLNLKARRDNLDKDAILKRTENITEYSQHLSETIDDFREFFKVNKEKREISFTELIDDALNIIEVSLLSSNITIVKELKTEKLINTYPNELKQVILNLIKNAEDAILEKNMKDGYIKIKTFITLNKYNLKNASEVIVLEVLDNAGGIKDDIKEKIFNPYFTTKNEKYGTGLGLYMSKIIIEEHCKGTLLVSNTKEGSSFQIILPLLESNVKVKNG